MLCGILHPTMQCNQLDLPFVDINYLTKQGQRLQTSIREVQMEEDLKMNDYYRDISVFIAPESPYLPRNKHDLTHKHTLNSKALTYSSLFTENLV